MICTIPLTIQPMALHFSLSTGGYLLKKFPSYLLPLSVLFPFPGYPQPTYRWLKDGVPVGDFSSSQFYRFHSTRREDAGSYQCIARNDAGSIFSEKSDVVVACKYISERRGETN